MSRIKLITIGIIILCSSCANISFGQKIKSYNWDYVIIDSTWNPNNKELKSTSIIAKYKPKVDALMVPIGATEEEMDKYAPESPLSNLAVDIIYKYGNKYLKENNIEGEIAMSMLNFGGIRTSLPKGDVTPYDILSIFPFDNRVVILNIQGKYLRGLFENFAKRGRVEAIGGMEIVINKGELEKALINGEPIDDNKFYNVATIDFLMNGGDNVYGLKNHRSVIETNALMRDVVIEYVQEQTLAGKKIKGDKDGRVVIIKSKE